MPDRTEGRVGGADELVGTRWRSLKKLQQAATICVLIPFAMGLAGTLILLRGVTSPTDLWRAYTRDKIQGPWRPLKLALRIVGASIAVVIAFPFLVIFAMYSVLRSPSGALRDLKRRREQRRKWSGLRDQGRVLNWEEAKNRVRSGEGTFIVQMSSEGDLERIGGSRRNESSLIPMDECPRLLTSNTSHSYAPTAANLRPRRYPRAG